MDWNSIVLVGGQVAVLVCMTVLVALGHDSVIYDVLLAVAGSLAGTGAYQVLKGKATAQAPEDTGKGT